MLILLAILGLCAGSFVSALTWRVHNKKDWVRGRSQCPRCGHKLGPLDLIPLVSWLMLRGRCRYCRKKISPLYPLAEVIMAGVFTLSYVFWPTSLASGGQKLLFTGWLAISVGLMALAVYDLRWRILPNRILYPTLAIALGVRLIYIFVFAQDQSDSLGGLTLGILVSAGVFWLIFQISSGKWIGYGDVRLGLVIGTVLASAQRGFLMIFLASALGSLASIPAILNGRQKLTSRISYGPFLILATFVSLLFGESIISWYEHFWQ